MVNFFNRFKSSLKYAKPIPSVRGRSHPKPGMRPSFLDICLPRKHRGQHNTCIYIYIYMYACPLPFPGHPPTHPPKLTLKMQSSCIYIYIYCTLRGSLWAGAHIPIHPRVAIKFMRAIRDLLSLKKENKPTTCWRVKGSELEFCIASKPANRFSTRVNLYWQRSQSITQMLVQ